MRAYDGEEMLFQQVQPYLRKLCLKRWLNLELEDRIAEANLVFCHCLRTWPLDTGHFLRDFERVFTSYMTCKDRDAPSRYHRREFSLDETHESRNGSASWKGYHILPGRPFDETGLYVKCFLQGLPPEERAILRELLSCDVSRTAVAEKHHMTRRELKERLAALWTEYETGRW